MNEQDHFEKIAAIRSRFPSTQYNIVALQKEYNTAIDEFKAWAKNHHEPVNGCSKVEPTLVKYKFKWVGEHEIEFLN